MIRKHNHFLFFAILSIVALMNCCNSQKNIKVVFEEKAGISRNLEYVKVNIADYTKKVLVLQEVLSGDVIYGIRLDQAITPNDSTSYIFPISIKANERKVYTPTVLSDELEYSEELEITGSGMSIIIENKHFIADFNTDKEKTEMGLYPGQLATLQLKNKNVLYKRLENDIHWAPNFQKEGLDYKTIGHLNLQNTKVSQNNPYMFEMSKSGTVSNYEEIDVFGQYNFFAGLPYFIYKSKMTFNRDTELFLLRNDEMTMDSLFTHLIYPEVSGEVAQMSLYNKSKFDSLAKAPLSDDIEWLGFVNKTKGYAFLSIRLEYNNKNLLGNDSPLYKAHTKISSGQNNGRYWNRRLIHDHNTPIPKGSAYYEKNAYLVLDNLDEIESQIAYYIKSLNNPILVFHPSSE